MIGISEHNNHDVAGNSPSGRSRRQAREQADSSGSWHRERASVVPRAVAEKYDADLTIANPASAAMSAMASATTGNSMFRVAMRQQVNRKLYAAATQRGNH